MTDPLRVAAAALVVLAALIAAWSAVTGMRRGRILRSRTRLLVPVAAGDERPVAGRRGPLRWWPRAGAGLLYGPPTAVAAGAGAALLVGGAAGAVIGLAAAGAVRLWQRRAERARTPAAHGAERAGQVSRQLPLAADLLAACLAAGAGPREAAEAVGRSLGGPLGELLRRVATELRLGGDPAQCWVRLGAEPGTARGVAQLGRCMERAGSSGVPPVLAVSRLADEYRGAAARLMHTRARRAGVLATGPLGLCFLPAFLLVGVAPLVAGLASAMLVRT